MKKLATSVMLAAVVLAGTGKVFMLAAGSPDTSAAYPTPANYRDFRYYALIIGIDIVPVNGSGSTCHEPFASRLAKSLKNWRCFSKGGIKVLKGAEGSKRRIVEEIKKFHLGPKDVLLIYYGGHGDWEGIATGDRQRLSPAELTGYMRGSGAGFKVLLLSSCYSGIFADPDDESDLKQAGFAVVTNGEEGGTSTYTREGIGFGPYLWQLLNKKNGPGEVVTMGEFTRYIKKRNIFWKKRGNYRLSDGRNSGPGDSVLFGR